MCVTISLTDFTPLIPFALKTALPIALVRVSEAAEQINEKLEKKMVSAFEEVSILMEQRKTSMRMAAFAVAIDRVAQAYALRGI